jgi:hypothetical protein
MKKVLAGALVCVSSVLVFASFASASHAKQPAPKKFSAALNVGQEVPHPTGTKVGAAGKFTATVTGTTLKWTLTFAHLSGSATASHIHGGVRGKSGAVLVPLCGPCSSPASGSATVTATQLAGMVAGKDYVNVHTAKNPNGEIRGQITRAA